MQKRPGRQNLIVRENGGLRDTCRGASYNFHTNDVRFRDDNQLVQFGFV